MARIQLPSSERDIILQGYKLRLTGAQIQEYINFRRTTAPAENPILQQAVSLSVVHAYIQKLKAAGVRPYDLSILFKLQKSFDPANTRYDDIVPNEGANRVGWIPKSSATRAKPTPLDTVPAPTSFAFDQVEDFK